MSRRRAQRWWDGSERSGEERSDMSLSVSTRLDGGGFVERGSRNGISSLLAQKSNSLSPSFWRMIYEIFKFKNYALRSAIYRLLRWSSSPIIIDRTNNFWSSLCHISHAHAWSRTDVGRFNNFCCLLCLFEIEGTSRTMKATLILAGMRLWSNLFIHMDIPNSSKTLTLYCN